MNPTATRTVTHLAHHGYIYSLFSMEIPATGSASGSAQAQDKFRSHPYRARGTTLLSQPISLRTRRLVTTVPYTRAEKHNTRESRKATHGYRLVRLARCPTVFVDPVRLAASEQQLQHKLNLPWRVSGTRNHHLTKPRIDLARSKLRRRRRQVRGGVVVLVVRNEENRSVR